MMWLKFLHIAGITVWVAGLAYLTAMLLDHRKVRDQQDFARIRMGSRFVYMGLASPAAFIAVGAGTALLFVSDALHPWMFVKLAAVGVLVFAHVNYGYILTHLADEEAEGPTLRIYGSLGMLAVSSIAILWLVLAKPPMADDALPGWLNEPGLMQPPAETAPAPPARPRLQS